jgi:hypothetical protein
MLQLFLHKAKIKNIVTMNFLFIIEFETLFFPIKSLIKYDKYPYCTYSNTKNQIEPSRKAAKPVRREQRTNEPRRIEQSTINIAFQNN